jgi:hypothetical protein
VCAYLCLCEVVKNKMSLVSGDSEDDSDNDSVFSDDSVEDDSAEARRFRRRAYRSKKYRSHGVLSKEWINARDAMKSGDSSAFAKIMGMMRKKQKVDITGSSILVRKLFVVVSFL